MATKNITREIVRVLRQFEIAGLATVPREITQVKDFEPRGGVVVTTFLYDKIRYFSITDNYVDDDTETLLAYIKTAYPDVKGEFVRNPHEKSFSTYGLKHKFHDVYLFKSQPRFARLDIELAKRYPEFSRSAIQKYIKAGHVYIRGEQAIKPKQEVSETDIIELHPPEKQDFSKNELPLLYMDDFVVVVNKPSGVLTHSKGALNDEFTVAEFMRKHTVVGLETSRPGIVHRLDRDTSGVLIGARTEEAASSIKKQFADRKVRKKYLAIVEGVPKLERAKIDLPIGRNPSAPSTFRVDPSGKSAVTYYEVLATDGQKSLLLLKPETGRTHQLRVHMQHINCPIMGDRVYGTGKVKKRLYLHALSLEVTTPPSRRQVFKAPAPQEFIDIFKEAKSV